MKIQEHFYKRTGETNVLQDAASQIPEGHSAVRCVFDDQNISLGLIPQELSNTPFNFQQRAPEDCSSFNVAMIIPTGVGASVGGHAGDATPILRAMGAIADTVITHPNTVNASDLNEQPENTLYVEGSILSRLLMGTVGLQPVRKNRVLVLVGSHPEEVYEVAAINSVNAARATFGFDCVEIVRFTDCHMRMEFSASGRATGSVHNVSEIHDILTSRDDYDAIAITSAIQTDSALRDEYYLGAGDYVNPWGGVEALLTHWVSLLTDCPSAHSPMMESTEVENIDYGVVDPRMAAEIISISYLQCILKGLQRAPRIVKPEIRPGVLTASNVSALVIPAGCYGLPIIAALQQGIPVIAVRDEVHSETCENLVRELPWQAGQFIEAENYCEAIGYLAALKMGQAYDAVCRPLRPVKTSRFQFDTTVPEKSIWLPDQSRTTDNGQNTTRPSITTQK